MTSVYFILSTILFKDPNQGFSTFSRPKAIFSLAYRLTDRKIKEDNLLNLHGNLLQMLMIRYCKQVPIKP
jgi:hypothetical protein